MKVANAFVEYKGKQVFTKYQLKYIILLMIFFNERVEKKTIDQSKQITIFKSTTFR